MSTPDDERPIIPDPNRAHDWKTQFDVDGKPYKYCVRKNCGQIWSRAHAPHKPEPTGCRGADAS